MATKMAVLHKEKIRENEPVFNTTQQRCSVWCIVIKTWWTLASVTNFAVCRLQLTQH